MGIMKPVKQQIILVDQTHNTIMVESAKGNRYNVDLNHYCGDINVGDTALVTKDLSGSWIMVDVINKYPHANPLDICQFPRTDSNDLNHVEYYKYRKVFDELHSDRERNEMNTFLIDLFKEKYGYDALRNVEPTSQSTLEEY
jgi:hypothetical protein